ncbi:MAG TPA: SURF1 family protein [Stellaceae bacterium]|nr:SURF1 family protein [Stellaceae bacterium]
MSRKSLVAPTLFTLFGLALLSGLGTWQVQRLHWKERLIAQRQAALAAPPVTLPTSLAAARALEFHPVRVTGRFRNDRELYLAAINERGDAGFQVLTPLLPADGAAVLVDRGFVPSERKAPASRAAGEPEGEVTVTGLLRLPPAGKSSWFVPDNRPDRNEWYWIDLPSMAAAAGIGAMLPFLIDADATPNPGGYPQGGQTPIALPNDHLQYALTWYGLAGTLLVFYILLVLRHRRVGDHK